MPKTYWRRFIYIYIYIYIFFIRETGKLIKKPQTLSVFFQGALSIPLSMIFRHKPLQLNMKKTKKQLVEPQLVDACDFCTKIGGKPLKSSNSNRVFHDINHPFWGKYPYFWFNTHVIFSPKIIQQTKASHGIDFHSEVEAPFFAVADCLGVMGRNIMAGQPTPP